MGYSCLSWLNLETVAGEKLEVSFEEFSQPKKMKGLVSKLFKDKKSKPRCVYYLSISVHTRASLSVVFDTDFSLYFMCERQHRKQMSTELKHYLLKYCSYFYDCYTCVKTAVWTES